MSLAQGQPVHSFPSSTNICETSFVPHSRNIRITRALFMTLEGQPGGKHICREIITKRQSLRCEQGAIGGEKRKLLFIWRGTKSKVRPKC